jgi:hypothetical protein
MLAKLSLHPIARSDRHHERRLLRKPRHRYEQPFIFHPNMDLKPHRRRTHTHSMLIIKNK